LLLLLAAWAVPAAGERPMSRELDRWVGRYALELRVASTAKLPLMPTDRSTTVSLLLVEVRPASGGRFTQHHRVCDVRVENSSAVQTTVPRAFVEALAPRSYPVELNGGSARWHYRADLGLDAIGFDPRSTGGALPAGPRAPGVIDSDGDGNPGATIEIRVPVVGRARLFIAQRTHLVLQATASSPDRVEGQVDIRLMEQRTFGAEPGILRHTPDIRPDPQRSGFTLVRLPDQFGCSDLRRHAHSLFPSDQTVPSAR
jgi:hypothetical protein